MCVKDYKYVKGLTHNSLHSDKLITQTQGSQKALNFGTFFEFSESWKIQSARKRSKGEGHVGRGYNHAVLRSVLHGFKREGCFWYKLERGKE